ncbi:uncharacterized protein LOC121864581 [Homarus americanus]|uniref:uncharacterized protein LOC121864581 n=1 Tax=Homarus americanus TaxID=6706 RepID=UPI001C448CE4|nr:uncharacterized protein LOC121864581 [Homarus americanus]
MRVMARWWWVMVLGCLVISVMGIRRWEFFAVRGKTFNVGTGTSGVIKSHNVSSTCVCKSLCFINSLCMSWTAGKVSAQLMRCHLSTQSPIDTTLVDNPAYFYGFMEDSFVGKEDLGVTLEEDNHHYFVPDATLSYAEAKEFCEKIPGFRPAILHSRQQLNIGLKMSDRFDTSELLVDLRNTPDGAFKRTWSDGTPFNVKFNNMIHDLTKTDEPYFRIKGNEYHAKNDGNNHFLCQC